MGKTIFEELEKQYFYKGSDKHIQMYPSWLAKYTCLHVKQYTQKSFTARRLILIGSQKEITSRIGWYLVILY